MKSTESAKRRDDVIDDVIRKYDGDITNGSDSSLESDEDYLLEEVKKYKSLYDASNKDVDSSLKMHTVYGTTEYSKFSLIKGNRGITDAHVNAIVHNIVNDMDLLRYNPILVNKNMGVLDGQHRLLAAQKAGVHVWYNVAPDDINLVTIANLNNGNKWNPKNFVSLYAVSNKKAYALFKKFYDDYEFSTSTALLLFGRQTMKSLREGTLHADDLLMAEELAGALMDVREYVKFAKFNRFADAFTRIYTHPEYDHKRMLIKLRQRKDAIVRFATVEDHMRMLEEIYNHKLSSDRKVRFF
jgi:hypothetical protein